MQLSFPFGSPFPHLHKEKVGPISAKVRGIFARNPGPFRLGGIQASLQLLLRGGSLPQSLFPLNSKDSQQRSPWRIFGFAYCCKSSSSFPFPKSAGSVPMGFCLVWFPSYFPPCTISDLSRVCLMTLAKHPSHSSPRQWTCPHVALTHFDGLVQDLGTLWCQGQVWFLRQP